MAHLVNKTQIYIGTPALASTLVEFAADDYEEIVEVHDLGEFGDAQEGVEEKFIGSNRLVRLKGTVDGGTIELIVNRNPLDAGQVALAAARKIDFDHNIKIILADKLTVSGHGTTFYFRAAVLGGRTSFGEADSIVRTTWSLGINSDTIEVPAS